ncbi:Lrp/AsnC ligand binding domain-containing protein [Latilactobacillus sakei]
MFEIVNYKVFREFCAEQKIVLKYYRIASQNSYLVKVFAENTVSLEDLIDETMQFGTTSTHIVFSLVANGVL